MFYAFCNFKKIFPEISSWMVKKKKADFRNWAELLTLSKTRTEKHQRELEKVKNLIPFDRGPLRS